MAEEKKYTISQAHHEFAIDFHGKTWDLLEKPSRTSDDNERMLDFAHASLAHWRAVGTAVRHQRGEWLLARVYTVLGNALLAFQHARRCMELLEANRTEMEDFDFAFAYEAMARALALAGKSSDAQEYIQRAQEAGSTIREEDDRQIFFTEFNGGNWYELK